MFKMIDNSWIKILVVILLLIGFAGVIEGGTCWVKRMESGKCKQPFSRNVSKEFCCSAGPNVGYTDKDMNEFEYFFAMALGDGTSCIPCIASCETANCGIGKRCVMRKGEPRCICSPMCKLVKNSKRTGGSDVEVNSKQERSSESVKKNKSKNCTENIVKNQRKTNKSNNSESQQSMSNGVTDVISKNSTVLQMNNDKIVSIASNSDANKNINKSKKNQSNLKAINDNLNVNDFFHKNRHHHKRKHRNKNNETTEAVQLNRKKFSSNGAKWADRIQSGFIGYDIPYPPNQFPTTNHGPYYNPVCGTDGRTYKTECQLKKRACRQETTSLTVAYRGQCQTSCRSVKCPTGQYCLEDQNLMPHCVQCQLKCPPYDESAKSVITNPSKMVCGTDKITYRNLCEIKRAACLAGRSIPVAYRGPCKDIANCENIKCKDRQICLNDLITHRPRCVSCSFKCPRRRQPQGQHGEHIALCGMNNQTYYSWCHMQKDSCHTGFFIDTKHNGACRQMDSVIPETER